MAVLVFDLDNTLLDRDHAIRGFLQSLGATSGDLEHLLECDERGYSDRLSFCDEVAKTLALSLSSSDLWAHMQRNLGSYCVADPARIAFVQSLRVKHRVVVLTNGGRENQRLKLRNSGFEECADAIVVAGEIGAWKPSLEAFRACELWGDETYVMIGDHPIHDVLGAKGAGWRTIWVSLGRVWESDEPPDEVCDTFEQLSQAIERVLQ